MENTLEYFKSLVDRDTLRRGTLQSGAWDRLHWTQPPSKRLCKSGGGADLIGRSLLACHNDKSKKKW